MNIKFPYKYFIATLQLSSVQHAFAGSGQDVIAKDIAGNSDAEFTGANIVGSFQVNQDHVFTSSGDPTPALTVKSGTVNIYTSTGGVNSTNTFGVVGQAYANLVIEDSQLTAGLNGNGTMAI